MQIWEYEYVFAAAAAKSRQSCPTLCDPIDSGPPGSRPWDSPGKHTGVGCHFLLQCMKVKSESEVAQSYPTLQDPMDCSLPGSSIHGISQARVLEWVAIAFSIQYRHEHVILLPLNRRRDWGSKRRNHFSWSIYINAKVWTRTFFILLTTWEILLILQGLDCVMPFKNLPRPHPPAHHPGSLFYVTHWSVFSHSVMSDSLRPHEL